MHPDSRYAIRQATIDDWPRIAAFINRNYGSDAMFKHRARWSWQFIDTPYGDADTAAPVWIALHEEEVVGQLALQPGLLRLGHELVPIGWIVDVMVDERHRGQHLSYRISDAIVATGRTLVTLTMAVATRKIMERAGCATLSPVHQMVRPGRLSGHTLTTLLGRVAANRAQWRTPIDWFVKSRAGPAMLAVCLSAAGSLVRATRRRRSSGAMWRTVAAPDLNAVDDLAARLVERTGASFDRQRAFFQWRFFSAPDLKYQYAEMIEKDEVRSVLVWRLPLPIELPVGTIVDILCDPDDAVAIGASIDHGVNAMGGRCEAIIAGASDPRFIREYAARGFVTVKLHRPTVVTRDKALLARIAGYTGPWHFSKADHDWDQVHPAEH